ncbi:MAG: HIT family protein [Candidatus Rokuibacteriota bacterium]
MSAAGCAACAGTWPPAAHRIADCGVSTAYLHDDQFFPGWTVLVLNRHATELFELEAGERATLMDEVARVAHALAREHGAVKVNYALLGNQLPHIHWHVIPRGANDPAPREAVWAVAHAPVAPGVEAAARIAAIRGRLAERHPG